MSLFNLIALAICCLVVCPDTLLSKEAPQQSNRVAGLEPAEGALILVRDGKPAATIVIGSNATPTVLYAVQELNEHLELSTGTRLPVAEDGQPITGPTIHVGATELTERLGLAPRYLAPDNWVVSRAGDALVLSGGDSEYDPHPVSRKLLPFGSLYAVYEFLERVVGVRWYWPGELGRVVPEHATLAVDGVRWGGAPTFDTRFAFNSYHDEADFTHEDMWKWWRRMRWGAPGGSPIGMHSFNDWPSRFGKEHPEWFALQDAGHTLIQEGSMGGHVCFNDEYVLAQTIADKRQEFDEKPWLLYSSVMPGDSMGAHMCRCEDCQAEVDPDKPSGARHSDYVWGFVNRVAREVRKTHPERIITSASYSDYSAIPENVDLESNIGVTLCIGSASQNLATDANARATYLERMTSWSERTEHIYVWDYWNNPRFDKGTYGAPTIFPHMIQDWFALERGRVKGRVLAFTSYDSEGIDITGHGNWADWIFDSLNVYIAMKLMWNLDQDVDAMLAEFYEAFYGPAGPSVQQFYEAMEAAYMDLNNKSELWDYRSVWGQVYPRAFVQKTMEHLSEAERVSRGQQPYHARAARTLEGFLPFEAASERLSAALQRQVENDAISVKATVGKPIVDGKLTDAFWRTAAVAGNFCDSFNRVDVHGQTEMRFGRDDENLYVGIRASLSGHPPLRTLPAGSEDDAIWMADDSAEIFFVEGLKKYQFVVGPDNIYTDNFHPDRTTPFTQDLMEWDCRGVVYEASMGENEWTAELVIPLASLDLALPTKDNPWRANFCRNHFYKTGGTDGWQRELSTWRPTFGSFHNVERFGTMWFE